MITIVTKNRNHYFGKIIDGKMVYSSAGAIAFVLWNEIARFYKNIVLTDEFVIMPDHMHGIISLKKDYIHGEIPFDPQKHKFTLTRIIASYKGAVKKYCDKLGFEFKWHNRFHNRIISTEWELEIKQRYILKNVSKWNSK